MANRILTGAATAVAQVDTATPANVEIGDIFTLINTDDNAATASIAFTATATTVANVTAGLTAAWNLSDNPLVRGITAADVTTHMTLTADVAGVSFVLTATAVNVGGGADTQTLTIVHTTANSGPADVLCTTNWNGGVVPSGTDAVYARAGGGSMTYGLTGFTCSTLTTETGWGGTIGRFGNAGEYGGPLHKLQLASCDTLVIGGSGSLVAVDTGSTAGVAAYVVHTGLPSAVGRHVIYLEGDHLDLITIISGDVAIGTQPGDTPATNGTIIVKGGSLFLGVGFTPTAVALKIYDGTVTAECGTCTTIVIGSGGTFIEKSAGETSITIQDGGTLKGMAGSVAASPTYTAITCSGAATLDFREETRATTITALTINGGATTIYDPQSLVTLPVPTMTHGGTLTIVR